MKREYYKLFYMNKFENLDPIDKLLRKQNCINRQNKIM